MYGLGSCVGNPRKIWVREWILQHLWDHGSQTKEEKVTRNESLHKTPICVLHQDLGAEADSRRKSTAMLPCSWEASGSQGLWDTVIIHLRSSFPLRKKKGELTLISLCHVWEGGYSTKPHGNSMCQHNPCHCIQWGNQVTTGLCLSCMPVCWWQCSMEPRAGMHAWEHWRLEGTISCSYMMESLYCCPTVIYTAAKETWKNWTRSPKEKNKSERGFSRHPALNPWPSYSLPDCLHIAYLHFLFL